MRFRPRPWVLAMGMIVACAVAAGWLWKSRLAPVPVATLASHMPSEVSTLISINVDALRSAGILDLIAGSPALEENDYRTFVDLTGFDYRQDLDRLLIGFRGDVTYVVMSGRFEWNALQSYARQQGGSCLYSFCRMAASGQKRNLSFFPMQSRVLALAAGPGEWSAWDLKKSRVRTGLEERLQQPIMISVSRDGLQHPERAPEAIRAWFQLLEGTEQLVLTVGGEAGEWEMHMIARCLDTAGSARVLGRLAAATSELKRFVDRDDKAAASRTLPGMLATGSFRVSGTDVEGKWPVSHAFLESLTGGRI